MVMIKLLDCYTNPSNILQRRKSTTHDQLCEVQCQTHNAERKPSVAYLNKIANVIDVQLIRVRTSSASFYVIKT